MGRIISGNKGTSSIRADLNTAVDNSLAVGGKVADIANEEIVPMQTTLGQIEADLGAAKASAAPVLAALNVAYNKAVGTVQLVHDMTWNHIGRPKLDQKMAMLFPDGSAHYIQGEPDKLPERMEFLAQLFEKGGHPRLSKDQSDGFAATLRDAAKAHSDAIDAARLPAMSVDLLERTQTAMGRFAHATLAGFKRRLKAAGFTEAQIHEIIPHRPISPPKKKAGAGATTPAPTAPAATATGTGAAPVAGSGSGSGSAPVTGTTIGSGSAPVTGSGSGSAPTSGSTTIPAAPTAPAQDGAGS